MQQKTPKAQELCYRAPAAHLSARKSKDINFLKKGLMKCCQVNHIPGQWPRHTERLLPLLHCSLLLLLLLEAISWRLVAHCACMRRARPPYI